MKGTIKEKPQQAIAPGMDNFIHIRYGWKFLGRWIARLNKNQKTVENHRQPIENKILGTGVWRNCHVRNVSLDATNSSESCCRAPFPEPYFARGILGNMFLQHTTPQGLKCSTTPIQGIQFGKIGMGAAVITPLNLMRVDAGIARLFCFRFCHRDTKLAIVQRF